ncbi:MAG: hypothetical protein JO012_00400 [Hyphomicrobiales bacterium]|nr:hypothetical protein [Hyphomicrobiales bacterium]
MIKRRTGSVGNAVRPVHPFNNSTSRGSVSGMPSISLAMVFQGQNDAEPNTVPNSFGSAMAA